MGDYTAVHFGAMQTAEAEFASAYQALHSTLSTLEAQLQSSLSQWTGEAQTAYYAAKKKWDAAAADMATVVSQLGQVVGVANENYGNAERTNTALWQ
ncbi:MAG: WXG100 family type VII secretion target [Actinobacteria bacterium]|nr:WXG100 family type VII secretion target [Actinomycetota bacterium]